jgi:hypothetical protein
MAIILINRRGKVYCEYARAAPPCYLGEAFDTAWGLTSFGGSRSAPPHKQPRFSFLRTHQRGRASARIYKVNLRSCPVSLREPLRHDSTFGLHRGSFRRTGRLVPRRGRDKCRRTHATRHDEWDRPSGPRNGAQPICAVWPLHGGSIAFEMMHQAPDRIERLALLDTSALSDTSYQPP